MNWMGKQRQVGDDKQGVIINLFTDKLENEQKIV